MKHSAKIILLTLAIPGLLSSWNALAQAAVGKAAPAGEEMKNCDHWEGKAKRLETLKADLKLNPSQEAAWTEWAGKMEADHKGWEEKRKNAESWAALPAPERMEKMLNFSKEHIAKQEERLAATKTFYDTLSPEQRTTFDKEFNFEHHGRPGRHGKK
jgi:hypothetical protein